MGKSCIHIRPVKMNSEIHLTRQNLQKLNYVRHDLTGRNGYWLGDHQSDRRAEIKSRYLAMTGQKMQQKSTPIREGIVLIEDSTTLEDLKQLGWLLQAQYGIQCIQIGMHKDEGHYDIDDDGERVWKPNLHAHMVFDWTDHKTGKTIKLNPQQTSEMQTLVAEFLGMERGKRSDLKHLTPLQYKEMKAKENASSIVRAANEKAADIIQKAREDAASIKNAAQNDSKAQIQTQRQLLEELTEKAENALNARVKANVYANDTCIRGDINGQHESDKLSIKEQQRFQELVKVKDGDRQKAAQLLYWEKYGGELRKQGYKLSL